MPIIMGGVALQTLIETLVDVVEGKFPRDNKYDLAVQILRYVHQQRTASEPSSEEAIEADVYRLWHSDEPRYYGVTIPCHLETVKGQDGVERLEIVSKPAPEPKPDLMPVSAPVFTPAVPLPVMQVSDVEKAAVKEIDLTFDERYSPGAVAARVAVIEKEAAAMRAARDQTI
jgi:hypothetical protein